MTRRRAASLLLLAHALLNVAVVIRLGFYSWPALLAVVVAGSVILFVTAGPPASGAHGADATPSARAVAAWLMSLALGGQFGRPMLYAEGAGLAHLLLAWNQVLFVGGAVLLVASFRSLVPNVVWGRVVFCLLAGATLLRLLVPLASPAPSIDVFSMREEGAAALLDGRNPYQTKVRDPILGGSERYGYSVGNYVYPPATLLPDALAKGVTGDVRVATALADLLACLCLVAVSRRRLPELWRSPAALLTAGPLLYSKGPYIIEQAWTEPLLVAALALWWSLAALGRERGALAAFGYFLALKQYLVFFALAFFGQALGLRRPRSIAIPALVVLATAIPFLIWDLASFLEWPVRWMFTESMPFRKDSLSLPNLLIRRTGIAPPATLGIVAGGAVCGLLLWRWWRRGPVLSWREDVVLVGVAATLTAFMFGPQAFANYYSFLTSALLLAVVGAGLGTAEPAVSRGHAGRAGAGE